MSSRNSFPLVAVLEVALLSAGLLWVLNAQSQAQRPPYDAGSVAEPRLFAEHIVSTEDDEVGGTFSPDGTDFYFVKVGQYTYSPRLGLICVSHFREGTWTQPEVLPFSGRSLDFPPKMSPDGRTLFFSSLRQAPGKSAHVLRIWSVERIPGGWGEPQALPAPVNADDSYNWGPSVTRDGTLYFASTRGGHVHIYRARYANGSYAEPEKLGPEINSEFNEEDPYISPDEKILIFASSGNDLGESDRPETLKGRGVLYARADLYISANQNGKWTLARHLEHGINSVAEEGTPSLTPDGKYLFFSSERSGFTVPTADPLSYDQIERMLHSTLNGHGNIYFVGAQALDFPETQGAR